VNAIGMVVMVAQGWGPAVQGVEITGRMGEKEKEAANAATSDAIETDAETGVGTDAEVHQKEDRGDAVGQGSDGPGGAVDDPPAKALRVKVGGPMGRDASGAYSMVVHEYPFAKGSIHLGRGTYVKPLPPGSPVHAVPGADSVLTLLWGGMMWERDHMAAQILQGTWRVCEAERPAAWAYHAEGPRWHAALWEAAREEQGPGVTPRSELREVVLDAADAAAVGRAWCYPFRDGGYVSS